MAARAECDACVMDQGHTGWTPAEAAQAQGIVRLARDDERLPKTRAGLPYVAFALLTLGQAANFLQSA